MAAARPPVDQATDGGDGVPDENAGRRGTKGDAGRRIPAGADVGQERIGDGGQLYGRDRVRRCLLEVEVLDSDPARLSNGEPGTVLRTGHGDAVGHVVLAVDGEPGLRTGERGRVSRTLQRDRAADAPDLAIVTCSSYTLATLIV